MLAPENLILQTKLIMPSPSADLVSRPRLVHLIEKGIQQKLVFVTAPSGFGKSTLLIEWATQTDRKTAWVSLERSENEPVEFLLAELHR